MSRWNPQIPTSLTLCFILSIAPFTWLTLYEGQRAKERNVSLWSLVMDAAEGNRPDEGTAAIVIEIVALSVLYAIPSIIIGWLAHIVVLILWKAGKRLWAAPAHQQH